MLPRNPQRAAEQVHALYQEIRYQREEFFEEMENIRSFYDGNIVLPLPGFEKAELPAVANLINAGIEQSAMRVASVMPSVRFEVMGTTDTAYKRADDQRRAVRGWWDMWNWNLLTRRRARHLVAYGMTVVSFSPCSDDPKDKRRIPFMRVRNPLATYPAPMVNPDNMEPDYCIFHDKKPRSWFDARYPGRVNEVMGSAPMADRCDLLEYVDEYETVLIAVGPEQRTTDMYGRELGNGVRPVTCLDRIPNRIGMVPVVVAGRITLDKLAGQFQQSIGAYRREATLDALNTMVIMRNVFPEQWAVSSSNSPTSPRVIRRANGKTGEIGVIDRGQLATVRPPMDQSILMAMDRYERAIRVGGGLPAQMSGEGAENIRTARQGDDLASAATDMWLQESQEIIAAAEQAGLRICINLDKAYFGKQQKSFFFGPDGKVPHHDYTPNELFKTDSPHVRYPMPGLDLAQMTVAFGQMTGMGEIDMDSVREMDPRVRDPQIVKERIEIEAVDKAFLTGIEQGAAQGTMDVMTIARIRMKMQRGKTAIQAALEVEEEMKQEQSNAATAAPETAAAPENQPGISGGGPAPTPAAPAAPGGKPSLEDLLAGLGGAPEQRAVALPPSPATAGV